MTKPLRNRPLNIENDPCDNVRWNARRVLARALVRHFKVDGVFFDGRVYRPHPSLYPNQRMIEGYLYGDAKDRFDHGWKVYSSLIKRVKMMTPDEMVWISKKDYIAVPRGTKLIETINSVYILMPRGS